jgi:hypothetical protein
MVIEAFLIGFIAGVGYEKYVRPVLEFRRKWQERAEQVARDS